MGLKSGAERNKVPQIMIMAMIQAWDYMVARGQTKHLLALKDIKFCCHKKHEVEFIENEFMRTVCVEPRGRDHTKGVRK